jgi:hypothetical protein
MNILCALLGNIIIVILEVTYMTHNIIKINRVLRNSRASVELEGLEVTQDNDYICRNLLNGEISNSEANRLILRSHGIDL